jgi:membrane associated rhomboid family serine protease
LLDRTLIGAEELDWLVVHAFNLFDPEGIAGEGAGALYLRREDLPLFLQQFGVVPAFFTFPTLVSSMFLHGSWSHVIGNMWYLWIFGDNVEDRVGHGRFIIFYLLCGVAAALTQIGADPSSTLPTIGASGAIAGVMGAYFVLYPQSRVLTLLPWIFIQIVELPAIVLLGFWFLMQVFSGIGSIAMTSSSHGGGGVAFMAHVGGFIVGAAGIFVFRRRQRDPWVGPY